MSIGEYAKSNIENHQYFFIQSRDIHVAGVNIHSDMNWNNSCGSWYPLVSQDSNALSPCFISALFTILSLSFASLGVFQLIQSLFYKNNFGGLGLRNTGGYHWIRMFSVFLQGLLYFIITSHLHHGDQNLSFTDTKSIGYGITFLTILFVFLPLHSVEVVSRVTASASLLLYWPLHIFLNCVVMIQQIFSDHKLVGNSKLMTGIEFLALINSIFILYMEYARWSPSRQLIHYYRVSELNLEVPNIISEITFSYLNKFMVKATTEEGITEEDIPYPIGFQYTDEAVAKLSENWEHELRKNPINPSLSMAVFKTVFKILIISLFLNFVDGALSVIQPQFLGLLISFFVPGHQRPVVLGLGISLLMFVISMLKIIVFNYFALLTFEAGLRAKSGLMSLVYQKALRLSTESQKKNNTGDIVNLVSVDVTRLQELFMQFQTLVSAPTKLFLALISLYALLGKSIFSSVIIILIVIPVNTFLVRTLKDLYKLQMTYKDARTKATNEILTSIKSIKLYSWENPMLANLEDIRNNKELKIMEKIGAYSGLVHFIWSSIPFFISCAIFSAFAFTSSNPLTPDLVFPALSLFNLISEPFFDVPNVVTALIETSVALRRISAFLTSDELDPELFKPLPKVHHLGEVSVKVSNATFLWSKPFVDGHGYYYDNDESELSSPKAALTGINFTARKGELSCIVGKVGSGKSSFIQALLGKLVYVPANNTRPVEVKVAGSVAYCSQVPWVMNASVKANILFGTKYEPDFYQRTIESCQLLDDLKTLPDGDATIVGEKGISLSGGQKARISLARTVYARADVYLLDDVLSAVDAHVGQNIVDQLFSGTGLLSSKTIILATNSISVLKHAKSIVALSDGKIVESGSYDQVMSNKSALYTLITDFSRDDSQDHDLEETLNEVVESDSETKLSATTTVQDATGEADDENLKKEDDEFEDVVKEIELYNGPEYDRSGSSVPIALEEIPLTVTLSHQSLRRASMDSYQRNPAESNTNQSRRSAQEVEKMQKGKVQWSVYMSYAKSCGYFGVNLLIFLTFLTTSLSVASSFWLKIWSESNVANGFNDNVFKFVGIYALLGMSSDFTLFIRALVLWLLCCIRASKILHDNMARAVMRSPMSFFETTPIGRIMNRFSNDINKIDEMLPRMFSGVFGASVRTLFMGLVIIYSMPIFIIIMIFLSICYLYYQKYYLETSRQLKRIASITLSPIFAHLQESLNGCDTIRAYRQVERFNFMNSANIDINMRATYTFRTTNRWLASRLQLIGSIVIFAASVLSLLTIGTNKPLSSGAVGLVMSYALQITDSLNWLVKSIVDVESNIVCVERVLEYSKLKSEALPIVEGHRPPPFWPSQGRVKFNHYSTKYRANLDPVLNDINLDIKSKEKIGIVGRTGAGKSTLTMAIFRLIEATEGNIEIDDIDISEIGLYDLRHKLSIIPQDSQALEGTIRQNLDPFGQYPEEELWRVLELSHLKDHVLSMAQDSIEKDYEVLESALDVKVSEGGGNLSVGQRQLMCLARALLNPSKLLILDEATAAVDVQTDKILQQTIRSEFKDKTILTIAHRLETVLDSDRVIVLEKGRVAEFDTPANLLANKDSIFHNLCKQGGYLEESSSSKS
ncbi:hypothetical protein PACTADRAFT_82780 [Pachysolen tannophilus NRRL Y-2460]|uniref:Bile pigment transporter 1 n=1 Tax=Pachysolen tannophilus NRRL Y-2460 TaxID=669874 RepID=A0A1E4TP55_PACTA|nr:hypothetical protein PACTADRAFT_82780 [Pachysolen tannophilus NRRL Y-2460]